MKRLLFLAILFPGLLFAQHTIKGVFSPPEDYKFALLYKVNPTVSVYVKNAEVKKDGSFKFQLDSTNTKGIYRLVYAVPQEDYNFDIIYNGKEDIELTFNSETGVDFKKSVENRMLASYTSSMFKVTGSISNYFHQATKDTLALKAIFKTQYDTQNSYEKASKGMIASHFIKANRPYMPKKVESVGTYTKNLKLHFFDAIDFNNTTLLSSNFLTEKMLNYVFGVSSDDKSRFANYKKNIDVFCTKMKLASPEIKSNLLTELWQQMADLNYEEVANYIADTYLIDLAVSLNNQLLLNALIQYKDISIGSKAPDFSLEIKNGNKKVSAKLSELNIAETYILIFWSSECSHCLEEIPQLQSFLKAKEKEHIKVIAVALEDNDKQWRYKIQSFPEFIHVLGLGKWDNAIGNKYGVSATPTYFILNKNKEITDKPSDFEDLKNFISGHKAD
ncbi:redoxin [Pseudalgibacter alginicilyticus]|uniref:Redoxin n=1 Tax=Pseudalgibacter alginicilyticus TaxID=1736674 RepID=A0A0P0D3F4_9FLAO|nr:TlpA disulfide reductase family protein [Pseudalgibacter alginicilyticus]ALJ05473.1 redoxin [Pseudalgibacter alginicilyticus]